MSIPSTDDVTRLLLDWSKGDRSALEKLMPVVYDELRRMAKQYMRRERPGHTLESTALVNEAYLKLVDCSRVGWQNRAHFFAVAAQLMRRILIDHARSRNYAKRGGGIRKVSLDEAAILSEERAEDLIAIDDALIELQAVDERKSKIVELRFFGGLNLDETAEVLGISSPTVQREWRKAKAWLYKRVVSRES